MTSHLCLLRIISLSILLAVMTASCAFAQAAQASSPPIPSWLTDKTDLLPKVTMDEYTRMESAWPRLQLSDAVGRKPSQDYWDALKTVVDLGEKAELALVWLYAQDASRLKLPGAFQKIYMFERVFSRDTTSDRWMLPLLRYRLLWMEELLNRGDHKQLESLGEELGEIQGYMNTRGEESDYRNVMNLIAKLTASNKVLRGRLSMLVEPSYDANARERDQWRKSTMPRLYAYHEMAKLLLASRDRPMEEAAKSLAGQIDSLAGFFPSLDAALQAKQPKITKQPKEQPSISIIKNRGWLAWLLIVITATFAVVWLFLRKRK